MGSTPLLEAARVALERGWYIFGVPARSKAPYSGTRGSKDADNSDVALDRWKTHPTSNPCVRLDKSGLTVLDIDRGLSSMDEAESWAKRNGLPETYIVQSGRASGGFHFYFRGVRDAQHPDVTRRPSRNGMKARVGFERDGASGDIKCHGHVVLEGALHAKTGRPYVGNGKRIAPAPDWLLTYRDPADIKARAQNAARTAKIAERTSDPRPTLLSGGARHEELLKLAGKLRYFGLEEEAIYLGLWDFFRKFCKEEKNPEKEIRDLAQYVAAKPCDYKVPGTMTGLKVEIGPTKQAVIEQALCRLFPVGHEPMPIHTIMVRINTEYPGTAPMTIRRAMRVVNFRKSGKDSADNRKPLWARHGLERVLGGKK